MFVLSHTLTLSPTLLDIHCHQISQTPVSCSYAAWNHSVWAVKLPCPHQPAFLLPLPGSYTDPSTHAYSGPSRMEPDASFPTAPLSRRLSCWAPIQSPLNAMHWIAMAFQSAGGAGVRSGLLRDTRGSFSRPGCFRVLWLQHTCVSQRRMRVNCATNSL